MWNGKWTSVFLTAQSIVFNLSSLISTKKNPDYVYDINVTSFMPNSFVLDLIVARCIEDFFEDF